MAAVRSIFVAAASALLIAPAAGLRASRNETRYNQFCGCMPWKTVMTQYNLDCSHMGAGICSFYSALDNNVCTNGKDVTSPLQQCYVSRWCNSTADLNGGGKITEFINWKVCDDTRAQKPDVLMRKYSLKNLSKMMDQYNLDALTTLHLAYQTAWFLWEDVLPFFQEDGYAQVKEMNRQRVFNKSLPKPSMIYQALFWIVDAGNPILFKTKAPEGTKTVLYGIVEGTKAYELTWMGKGALDETLDKAMKVPGNSWSQKKWRIECVAGCSR